MPTDEKRKPASPRERLLIENIKNARKTKNLTQEGLSAQLKRNNNYMGMVESHRRGISFKTLFKIADALNVKVKQLFENI